MITLTVEIEKIEKNPDDYKEADMTEIKIKIKQVEALIKELQVSINSSTTVFESLHVQVCPKLWRYRKSPHLTVAMFILWPTIHHLSDHSYGEDLEQSGEDLRQELGSCDPPRIHQVAGAAGGVRETTPGAFQPQHR